MELTAKGQNGTVIFDGQMITIRRGGFFGTFSQGRGEKRIPLASVHAVQFKKAGAVARGFIAFTIGGGNEKQSRFGSQIDKAWNDENSVVFLSGQCAAFEEMREAVELAVAALASGRQTPAQSSAADQLAKLAELHTQGVLSDDEFAAAKAKALGI